MVPATSKRLFIDEILMINGAFYYSICDFDEVLIINGRFHHSICDFDNNNVIFAGDMAELPPMEDVQRIEPVPSADLLRTLIHISYYFHINFIFRAELSYKI